MTLFARRSLKTTVGFWSKINKLLVVLDVIRYNYHCIIRANSARGEIFYNADIEGSIDRTAHYSVRRFCYISSLKQF